MSKKIMTLGVFAHANAGKTTITEQLLVHTNVKKNTGRVDHGDTTTDNMKIEQERGISVKSSMVTLPLEDRVVQLIDTPGHVDFSAEVERAISVLDGAILVVSGVEGVEPQTQVIWKILRERNVPTLLFINKMDRMGADYDRTLNELQQKLDSRILPKVKVSKSENGLLYEDISSIGILEEVADIDEEVLVKFLNDEEINKIWLDKQIEELSKNGEMFFVYGGSALQNEGMSKLINGISLYLPTFQKPKQEDFSGYVYTVKRDSGVRELYIKILNGELQNRQTVLLSSGAEQRIRTMTKIEGSNRVKANELSTGEIGIITGIDANCGELIGNQTVDFQPVSFVNPLFETTINAKNNEDTIKLVESLSILTDEDPELQARYDKQTGEITVKLMGALQSEVINNILQERFGVDSEFSEPIIIHKETPINSGYGKANYTRVSGVAFEVKPLPKGSGIQYKSKFSTDYLFPKYQKQVERLVQQYIKQGLYGWEVTDAEIALVDGKCDHVGSDPSHFNIAVPIALMRAFKDCGMKLLEPNILYEINFPSENLKQILSITSNYGVLYDSIIDDNVAVKLKGIAPLKQIIDLPAIVTRVTSGHGAVIEEPYGYVDCEDLEPIEKKVVGCDPRNEELFIMDMGASIENLDIKRKRR